MHIKNSAHPSAINGGTGLMCGNRLRRKVWSSVDVDVARNLSVARPCGTLRIAGAVGLMQQGRKAQAKVRWLETITEQRIKVNHMHRQPDIGILG